MATGTFRDDSHTATEIANAIAMQHTTDNGLYSTPASVATLIANQHTADNASYVPRGSLRYNIADYGAATTATDNAAAIQAAADAAAAAGGVLFMPGGTYPIASKVTLRCNVDVHPDAVLSYTGPSNAVAVQVGDGGSGVIMLRRLLNLPRVLNANKTGSGWAGTGVVDTSGVKLVNCFACKIHVPHVQGFVDGLWQYGSGTGNVYNYITVGHLDNNQRNERYGADATGWCNDNHTLGGIRSHESAEGTAVAATRQILIETAAHQINNNRWFGGSVEGDTAEYHLDCSGLLNVFRDVRWEVTGGARVRWGTAAGQNLIDGGYDAYRIVETFASAGTGNSITVTGRTSRVRSAGGAAGVVVCENSTSSANPVDYIMEAGAAAGGSAVTSAYAVARSAQSTGMKRASDAYNRLLLDHVNGRLYIGNGTAAPNAYLQGQSGYLFVQGGNLSFLSDNTYDIGGSASLRPRSVYAGTDVKAGGVVQSGKSVTGSRPSASTSGAGARWYDTTLTKPIWSDGTVWRDAAGTAV